MPLDPQLRGQLRQTIQVQHQTGYPTGQGVVTYGATTNVAARLEPHIQSVLTQDGETRDSSHRIVIDSTFTPLLSDIVTLPAGAGASMQPRAILSIQQAIDELGATDHWEILI